MKSADPRLVWSGWAQSAGWWLKSFWHSEPTSSGSIRLRRRRSFPQITAFSQTDTLVSLVTQCDGITLHVPSANTPLLDSRTLNLTKSGSVIVNTARAGLIDPDAMLRALQTGKISTYCTDVFDTEPPDLTPLLKHERCIRTSHIGGLTRDSVERITRATVDNLLDGLQVSCE